MLSLFPLIRRLSQRFLATLGTMGEELASLEACGVVLDEYVMIKRGVRGDGFLDAARNILHTHRRVYGEHAMKPKHHWCIHLPGQLLRDQVLVDTFPLERLHQVVKSFA